jgi:hypothetical protein
MSGNIDIIQGGALLAFLVLMASIVRQAVPVLIAIRDALVILEVRTRWMDRKRRPSGMDDPAPLPVQPRGRRQQAWTPLAGVPILGRQRNPSDTDPDKEE